MKIGKELLPAFTGAVSQTSPGSAVDVVFSTLAIAALDAPDEEEEDTRAVQIADYVAKATPETRTHAAKLAAAMIALLSRLHSIILIVKSDLSDPDVTHGSADVQPEGWLVVKMDGAEIGRVPYNPNRGQDEASRMAEEMLSEHVRLHVMQATDVVAIPRLDAEDSPPRPDGVRARRIWIE